jgi:hypothetical protein
MDANTLAAIQSVCAAAVAVVASLTTVWTARHHITVGPPDPAHPNGTAVATAETPPGP